MGIATTIKERIQAIIGKYIRQELGATGHDERPPNVKCFEAVFIDLNETAMKPGEEA